MIVDTEHVVSNGESVPLHLRVARLRVAPHRLRRGGRRALISQHLPRLAQGQDRDEGPDWAAPQLPDGAFRDVFELAGRDARNETPVVNELAPHLVNDRLGVAGV